MSLSDTQVFPNKFFGRRFFRHGVDHGPKKSRFARLPRPQKEAGGRGQ
jgi:hypothetical protein